MYSLLFKDFTVLSDHAIDRLLALGLELLSPGEDAVIWHGATVVCVLQGDGRRVTWLAPQHQPAA